jgi:hypothetical protein
MFLKNEPRCFSSWILVTLLFRDRRRYCGLSPGTDVMILKIFSPKNLAKKSAFLTQNKAKLCMQNYYHNIGF